MLAISIDNSMEDPSGYLSVNTSYSNQNQQVELQSPNAYGAQLFHPDRINLSIEQLLSNLNSAAQISYGELINIESVLNDFAKKLAENQVDLDFETKSHISQNLWDLYD